MEQVKLNDNGFENYIGIKMAELSCTNNLQVSWIKDDKMLEKAGKDGLFSMYCNIFAEEPYCEKFTEPEVKDYFGSMIDKGGMVFTARLGASKLLTAFVASVPLVAKPAVVEVVSPYVDISNCAYFAEDAVRPEYRRRGISSAMKGLLLSSNRAAGFKTMLLRTSVDSFNQAAAVNKAGGKKIEGLYQDVPSLRLDGQTKPDRRQFFTFNLS